MGSVTSVRLLNAIHQNVKRVGTGNAVGDSSRRGALTRPGEEAPPRIRHNGPRISLRATILGASPLNGHDVADLQRFPRPSQTHETVWTCQLETPLAVFLRRLCL